MRIALIVIVAALAGAAEAKDSGGSDTRLQQAMIEFGGEVWAGAYFLGVCERHVPALDADEIVASIARAGAEEEFARKSAAEWGRLYGLGRSEAATMAFSAQEHRFLLRESVSRMRAAKEKAEGLLH